MRGVLFLNSTLATVTYFDSSISYGISTFMTVTNFDSSISYGIIAWAAVKPHFQVFQHFAAL